MAYRPLISTYKDITIYYLPEDIISNYQPTRSPRLS